MAALKASTPDSILVDAGGSLHGTTVASMTGGMDMLSSFSAAGYDLQAFGAEDLAYGISRLRSDANMEAVRRWLPTCGILTVQRSSTALPAGTATALPTA